MKRAGYIFAGAYFSVGEEPAHSFGTPLVECLGFLAAGRQTRVRKGRWASSEVRCTGHAEVSRPRCGCRSVVLRRGCVPTRRNIMWFLVGYAGSRGIHNQMHACRVPQKVIAFSVCPSPKLKRKPLGRNARTLARVQPPLVAASPCAWSEWPGSCTIVQFISPNSSDEAVVAFCWRSVHHKKRCNTHVPEVGRVNGRTPVSLAESS